MIRFFALSAVASSVLSLGACKSAQPAEPPVRSTMNLPVPPEPTIRPVATISRASPTQPMTIDRGRLYRPSMSPPTVPAQTREANERAIRSLQESGTTY